jgi:hypothetical protein
MAQRFVPSTENPNSGKQFEHRVAGHSGTNPDQNRTHDVTGMMGIGFPNSDVTISLNGVNNSQQTEGILPNII